jgi:hypothetical protein
MSDKRTPEQLRRQVDTLARAVIGDSHEQKRYAVESVDPDWREHYRDLDMAFRDYWQDDDARADMITELVGGLS